MSKRRQSDRLRFVRRVTRQRALVFTSHLCSEILGDEVIHDAFRAAGVMAWPASDLDDTPAKLRYVSLKQEILERTLDYAGLAIAAAFERAANDVIERERKERKP